jgi:hypothetical protein
MSMLITNAIPVTQLAYAAASITASYTLVGSFTSPLVWMDIVSTLDAAVQVSFDGVHDHIVAPIGNTVPSMTEINFKANRTVLPIKSIYVKRIGTPSTGSIYFSGFTAQTP